MRLTRLPEVAREELGGLRPGLAMAVLVSGLLPDLVANRVRTALFRRAGVAIGRGTVIGGKLTIAGPGHPAPRVSIGELGWINAGCYFDASDTITIGDDVALAQGVTIVTQTHDVGPSSRRAAALRSAPVTIGDGCWLGARVTVLPGVTIGRGAIVAAGAVVNADVAPDTLVGGVPAKPIKALP
jgi:maltose O-acetyltransferase